MLGSYGDESRGDHKLNGVNVLIVDDERLVRWSVRYFLEKEGYIAQEASSANEALEILASSEINVLITDLMMPGMHGVELINQARKASPGISVLVITAIDDCDVVDSAHKAGAVSVFSKPIRFNELLSAIHGLDRGERDQRPGAGC